MPVLALEVKPTPLVQVVDLPIRPRARPAPEDDPLVPDTLQDRVELLVRGQEGVVVRARVVRVIEVQRQYVVDLDRREVPPGSLVLQPEHSSDELRGLHLVVGGHDCVVQLQRHGGPLPDSVVHPEKMRGGSGLGWDRTSHQPVMSRLLYH